MAKKSFHEVITRSDLPRGTKVHIGPSKTEVKNGKGVVSFTFEGTPVELAKQLVGKMSSLSVVIEPSDAGSSPSV